MKTRSVLGTSALMTSFLFACADARPPAVVPPVTVANPAPATTSSAPASTWNAAPFRSAIDANLEAMLRSSPEWATERGDHRFDDLWSDISEAGEATLADDWNARAKELRILAQQSPRDFAGEEAGSDHPSLDAQILADSLDALAYEMVGLRTLEWNPGAVLDQIGSGLSGLTSHPFASLRVRMASASARLAKVPELLHVARARLKAPSRATMENVAIVAPGLQHMLDGELSKISAKDLDGDAALALALPKNAHAAALAIAAYARELGATFPIEKLENKPIGAEKWATMARLREGVVDAPSDIRKMGEAELVRLHAELDTLMALSENANTSANADKRLSLTLRRRAFFKGLEADHPKADKVLDEYRTVNKGVEEWMRKGTFATVPWDKAKLEIVQTPPQNRGTSFASMNAAGALEKTISDAQFEVNSPDDDMPKARAAALLAFHARGAIEEVSVHEALPGHYLQILHQRESKSTVRKLLWAATMGEGWAHYCEQATIEAGYTGKDPARTRAFYVRMALQRAARVVVDVAENDGSMTPAQGATFLEENAMLGPEAAKMEARRAVVSPVYMFTYTYGKQAILRLREKVKAKEGAQFDLVRFHDRLLSVGAIPVKYVGPAAFGIQ